MNRLRELFQRHFSNERRRAPRYGILQPLFLRAENDLAELQALGLDLSERGILLKAPCCIMQNTHVSVLVELTACEGIAADHGPALKASGHVVRVQRFLNGEYEAAVEFDRAELAEHQTACRAPE